MIQVKKMWIQDRTQQEAKPRLKSVEILYGRSNSWLRAQSWSEHGTGQPE